MRIAIIGCGLIGNKRAAALGEHSLVAVADPDSARAAQLAARHAGCESFSDWREAALRSDVDLVIVSTTNDMLAPITVAAASAGKHVLVEKPAAQSRGIGTSAGRGPQIHSHR